MTDEERQKLVADLREFTGLDNEPWLVRVGREAADEIEWLAALVQSDAEPRPDAFAELIEAAEELADLMDDVVRGNYKPDSFTTQPLRRALRARATDRSEK